MNYRKICNIIGRIFWVEAAFMLPPLGIAVYRGEHASVRGFLIAIALLAVLGMAGVFLLRPRRDSFYARDGLMTVGLAWILVSFMGGLPFFFSGSIPSLVDCFFETVSGFTTTGASILPAAEDMPLSDMYWRCFTIWLGGMGVLVFVLAVSPKKGSATAGDEIHLLRAESPGVTVDKLVPRMRQSATILYTIYIALTILQVIFLLSGGMSLYEALVATYATAGTGGFGMMNDSFASYSPYIQVVVTVFMLLFAVNFNVYFLLLIREFRKALCNQELIAYLGIVAASIAVITWNISHMFPTLAESLRHAAFQVASIISTTGFMSTDFDLWPELSRTILILLMFVGACAGSTGGGLKVIRVVILAKAIRRAVLQAVRPNSVRIIRVDGAVVDEDTVRGTLNYFAVFMAIQFLSVLLVSIDNFDFVTNFTAVATCFNNVGPGLGGVGPTRNFTAYSDFSKLLLSANMLLGRLELYPILAIFVPSTYKK